MVRWLSNVSAVLLCVGGEEQYHCQAGWQLAATSDVTVIISQLSVGWIRATDCIPGNGCGGGKAKETGMGGLVI